MTNDCKTCPVSTGTHKPAEAVHQIDEPQAEALLELAAYRFTVANREARIAELEKENSYLNNACAELEAQLEAIGAGGVEPLRKQAAAPQAVQAEVDLPDVEDMAHSALQEALSFGLGHDVLHRWMRKVMTQTQAALSAPAHPAEGVPAQGVQQDALKQGVDRAHYILSTLGYHRDGDFFVNVNRVGAEAIHVSTIAAIANAAFAAHPTQQGLDALDAARYRWLRERDLETVHKGGVFAGMTPENYVINGVDLDAAIDAAIAAQAKQGEQP